MRRLPLGILTPLPPGARWLLVLGVALWRGITLVLPVALGVAGFLADEWFEAFMAAVGDIPLMVHLATFGMIALFSALIGLLVVSAALLLAVFALPLAFVLDWQLRRLLLAAPDAPARPVQVMAGAGLAGVVAHLVTTMWLGPLTHVFWLTPVAVAFLVTRESSRAALRSPTPSHGQEESSG